MDPQQINITNDAFKRANIAINNVIVGSTWKHKFIKVGSVPRIDIKGRTIYSPPLGYLTPEQNDVVLSSCIHENAHARYTPHDVDGKTPPLLFDMINCVEDLRVNEAVSREFLGAGFALERGHRHTLAKIEKKIIDGRHLGPVTEAMMALTFEHENYPMNWQMTAKSKEYYDLIGDTFRTWRLLPDLYTTSAFKGVIELCTKMYELVLKKKQEDAEKRLLEQKKKQLEKEKKEKAEKEAKDKADKVKDKNKKASKPKKDDSDDSEEQDNKGEPDDSNKGDKDGDQGKSKTDKSESKEDGDDGEDTDIPGETDEDGKERGEKSGTEEPDDDLADGIDGKDERTGDSSDPGEGEPGEDKDDDQEDGDLPENNHGDDDIDEDDKPEDNEDDGVRPPSEPPQTDDDDQPDDVPFKPNNNDDDVIDETDGVNPPSEPPQTDDKDKDNVPDPDKGEGSDNTSGKGDKSEDKDTGGDPSSPKNEDSEPELTPEEKEEIRKNAEHEMNQDTGDLLDKAMEQMIGDISKKSLEDNGNYTFDSSKDKFIVPDMNPKDFRERYKLISSNINMLSRYVEQSLVTLKRATVYRGQEQGTLDMDMLYLAGKSLSKKVFYDTKQGFNIDTSVSIVIDESGSMSGCQCMNVSALTIAFSFCLDKLHIPFEIIGTTTEEISPGRDPNGLSRTNPMIYRVYKSFSEQWDLTKTRLGELDSHNHNVDGEAIDTAGRRIKVRKERRKVILSMSDGLPMAGHNNDDVMCRNLKLVCKRLRASGIEVYGFGIGTVAPKDYYGKEYFVFLEGLDKMGMSFFKRFYEIIKPK